MEVRDIAIDQIVTNPMDPRDDVGDLTSLTASIAAIGLLEPLVVREVGDVYLIVSGHRRTEACRRAGVSFVPCSVVSVNDVEELTSAIAANTLRVNLTAMEIGVATAKLAGLGASDEEISAAIGIKQSEVKSARAIAKVKVAERRKFSKDNAGRQFTLEEAAALLAYGDDNRYGWSLRQAVERGTGLQHVLATIKAQEDEDAAVAALKATMKGYAVIPRFNNWDGPKDGVQPLFDLVDADGKPLTAKTHDSCPAKAYQIDVSGSKPQVVPFCKDYLANGHTLSPTPKAEWNTRARNPNRLSNPKPKVDPALKALEEANDKAWEIATEVRMKWLESFGERKTLLADAKVWILTEALSEGLDATSDPVPPSSIDRLIVMLGSRVFEQHEDSLTYSGHPWRLQREDVRHYFTFLASLGYELSDVERLASAEEPKAKPAVKKVVKKAALD